MPRKLNLSHDCDRYYDTTTIERRRYKVLDFQGGKVYNGWAVEVTTARVH
jgi:hypothetical protein